MKSTSAWKLSLKILEILHYLVAALVLCASIGAVVFVPWTKFNSPPFLYLYTLLAWAVLSSGLLIFAGYSICQRKRLFFLQSFHLFLMVAITPFGVPGTFILHAPAVVDLFNEETERLKTQRIAAEEARKAVLLAKEALQLNAHIADSMHSRIYELTSEQNRKIEKNRIRYICLPILSSVFCLFFISAVWIMQGPSSNRMPNNPVIPYLSVVYVISNFLAAYYANRQQSKWKRIQLTPLFSLNTVQSMESILLATKNASLISEKTQRVIEAHQLSTLLAAKFIDDKADQEIAARQRRAVSSNEIELRQTTLWDTIFCFGSQVTIAAALVTIFIAYFTKSIITFMSALSVLILLLLSVIWRYRSRDRTIRFSNEGFWCMTKVPIFLRWQSIEALSATPQSNSGLEFSIRSHHLNLNFSCDDLSNSDLQRIYAILKDVSIANGPFKIDSRFADLVGQSPERNENTSTASLTPTFGEFPAPTEDSNLYVDPNDIDVSLTYPVFWKQSLKDLLVCLGCRLLILNLVFLKQELRTPEILSSPLTYLVLLLLCAIRTPRSSITFADRLVIPNVITFKSEIQWIDIDEMSFQINGSSTSLECLTIKVKVKKHENLITLKLSMHLADLERLLKFLRARQLKPLLEPTLLEMLKHSGKENEETKNRGGQNGN